MSAFLVAVGGGADTAEQAESVENDLLRHFGPTKLLLRKMHHVGLARLFLTQ